ncbi:MAG: LD-carboxypeptidase [Bacteroidota bacterium]|nr:LD-carboxypeptidase [Bacteroidota bacterium]
MQRRNFIRTISVASALSVLSNKIPAMTNGHNSSGDATQQEAAVIKPKRLKKGDRVGLVAPGSFITESELKESITNLENLGLKAVYSENILSRYGYLGGKDSQRSLDLNNMFARKDVDAIMCVRGGYGCARILPSLDYNLIKENPKILIGYSDITALINAIFKKTGLISFHGPVGISTFNEFSLYYFKNTLVEPVDTLTLWNARDENPQDLSRKVVPIRNGKATGQLVGGNLSIVVSMIGTPYDINMDGKIVFLEEVGEEPYRIDRMLTQMIEAGKFDKVAGVALGVFEKCEAKEKDPSFVSSLSLMEVLFDRLFDLGVPVIYGLSFGHVTNKFTLPVGLKVELDVDSQVIRLLEPAVC